jgi:hypothetical protein
MGKMQRLALGLAMTTLVSLSAVVSMSGDGGCGDN